MKGKIEIGDKAPQFTLENQHGETFNINDHLGSPMVIYFYPKDDTPGCTKEACFFRDQFDVFQGFGAVIIGISGDSPKSHLKFAKKYNLNFTLLSDVKRKVEKLFGVPRSLLGLLPGRVTYIIDKDGVIRHTFNSQTNPEKHVKQAIKMLESF